MEPLTLAEFGNWRSIGTLVLWKLSLSKMGQTDCGGRNNSADRVYNHVSTTKREGITTDCDLTTRMPAQPA
jgi:hypothetical protein